MLGTTICALSNIAFGFLDYVNDSTAFFVLSIVVRVVTAMGESAIPNSCMALASNQMDKENRGKAVATCEACFGLGTIFGPSIGGLLYDAGGFSLPFWAHGSAQILVAILSALLIKEDGNAGYDSLDSGATVEVTWLRILAAPDVLLSSVTMSVAGLAWVWYAASLEPFLADTYGFSASSTGLVFMTVGITYTIFTPIFGAFMDRGMNGLTVQVLGAVITFVGFCLLGPLPVLQGLLGSHAWITVLAIGIQGIGFAAIYLGSLMHMLKGAQEARMPDNDQVNSCLI